MRHKDRAFGGRATAFDGLQSADFVLSTTGLILRQNALCQYLVPRLYGQINTAAKRKEQSCAPMG